MTNRTTAAGAIAACVLAATAMGAARAQAPSMPPRGEYPPPAAPGPAMAPTAPGPGAGAAPDSSFAGQTAAGFYDLDGRMARIEQRIGTLPAAQRAKARKALRAIRGEAAYRRKRKGELKDWDLEHLHMRLNALVQRYPALER